jgi:U3 small nucleolar RNA-associated protein 11
MSSIRNAVKRKTHKERAQPSNRERFGLLEKKKDYVLRAKDHNVKKRRIQAMQEKAAFRNPDEFYFKMQSSATKQGLPTTVGTNGLDTETVMLLKSQDLNYISMKKRVDERKIEKLESSLHCISAAETAGRMNKHTIFFDSDDEEEDMRRFDPAQHFDTHPDLVDRAVNRPRKEQLEGDQEIAPHVPRDVRKKVIYRVILLLLCVRVRACVRARARAPACSHVCVCVCV